MKGLAWFPRRVQNGRKWLFLAIFKAVLEGGTYHWCAHWIVMLCVNRDVSILYMFISCITPCSRFWAPWEGVGGEWLRTHGQKCHQQCHIPHGPSSVSCQSCWGDQQHDVQLDPGMGMSLVGIFLFTLSFLLILVVCEGEHVT